MPECLKTEVCLTEALLKKKKFYVYSFLCGCMLVGQKRAPDLTDGYEPLCGCWD